MVHGLYRPWMRSPGPTFFNRTVIVQQPHCHHSGGSGFWGGFLGGLFGGAMFGRGGLFSGLFGFGGMQTGMPLMGGYMGMPMMGGYSNPYAFLNNNGNSPAGITTQTNPDLQILEKHFGDKYTISERNGQFIATAKDGKGEPIVADNFNDMLHALGGDPEISDRARREADALAAERLEAEGGDEGDGNDSTIGDGNDQASGTDGKRTDVTTEGDTDPQSDPVKVNPENNGTGETGSADFRSKWTRTDATEYKEMSTADEVMNAYLRKMGINPGTDTAELKKLLIANNESVFDENGNVKADADWSKLDLPNMDYLTTLGFEEQKWQVYESPGWFSGDTYMKGANGTIYKLVCDDGAYLNFSKLKIEDGAITTDYERHPIEKIRNHATGQTIPARRDEDGRIRVQINDEQEIYLETFLNNPEKYLKTETKKNDPPAVQPDIQPKAISGGWSGII